MKKIKPRFITIEGMEGAGKSTNIEFISKFLTSNSVDFLRTREPGGTLVSEKIRELLLEKNTEQIVPMAELLLVFAARAQHIEKVILPALTSGKWVLCDRFTDATYAYQGEGRCLGGERVNLLENFVQQGLQPDLTIILDVPVDLSLERVLKRGDLDRFEIESASFFKRVRDAYYNRVESAPDRYFLIDASKSLQDVQADIKNILDDFLNN
tara:strand:- start:7 stop:639 length:633 start_codon:yes stop_codon:yes gene_type:complete